MNADKRWSDLRIQRKLRLTYRRHASLSAAAQGFLEVARALAADQPGDRIPEG